MPNKMKCNPTLKWVAWLSFPQWYISNIFTDQKPHLSCHHTYVHWELTPKNLAWILAKIFESRSKLYAWQKTLSSVELISSDGTDVLHKQCNFSYINVSVWVCLKKKKNIPDRKEATEACSLELWSHIPVGLRSCEHGRQEETYKARVGGERNVM